MGCRMEFADGVYQYLAQSCEVAEQEALLAIAKRWEEQGMDTVIAESSVYAVPGSRYVLRWFRFGGCLALFELDLANEAVRIIECQRTLRL